MPDYEAVLADLYAKRDQIETAINAIQAIAGMGSAGAARSSVGVAIQGDSFFGMNTLDAAIKYLGIVRKVQSPTEIADALEAGGMTHSSQNLANTLYTTLSRSASHNGPVVKVGKNWGLREWYPGLKSKSQRLSDASSGATPVDDDEDDPEPEAQEQALEAAIASEQQQPS